MSIAYCNSMISIHASAKEATEKILELAGIDDISIHASAKEATDTVIMVRITPTDFNPRLREGGDVIPLMAPRIVPISIHASAKEATSAITVLIWCGNRFQSTPPRRRRRTFHSLFIPANMISIHASAKEATAESHHLPA